MSKRNILPGGETFAITSTKRYGPVTVQLVRGWMNVRICVSHFIMSERVEQEIWIKFYQKLGHFETIGMVCKVFGDESTWNTYIKELFRTLVDCDPRSGRPATTMTTENVKHVRATINKNHRLS